MTANKSPVLAPLAEPFSAERGVLTEEAARTLAGTLSTELRSYLGSLVTGGLELYAAVREGKTPAELADMPEMVELQRFRALRADFAESAAAFDRDGKSPDEMHRLNERLEEAFYPQDVAMEDLHAGAGNAFARALDELESAITELMPFEYRHAVENDEAVMRSLFPDTDDGLIRSRVRALNDLRAAVEYLSLSYGFEFDSPIGGEDDDEDDDRDEDVPQPVRVRDMTAALRRMSRASRSQYAWVHNHLFSMTLSLAGGRLAGLDDALRAAGAEPEEIEAVMSQYRDSATARAVFARDAKAFRADGMESEDLVTLFERLAELLRKPSCEVLTGAMALLLLGFEAAAGCDAEAICADYAEDEDVSYDDWVALAGGIMLAGSSEAGLTEVKLSIGRVDPRTVKVPGFSGEAAWKSLADRLSVDDRHSLARYIKDVFVLYDEATADADTRAAFRRVWEKMTEVPFADVDGFMAPARAMLLPAVLSTVDDGAAVLTMPSPCKFLCGHGSMFRRFAGEVIRAYDGMLEAHVSGHERVIESLALLGAVGTVVKIAATQGSEGPVKEKLKMGLSYAVHAGRPGARTREGDASEACRRAGRDGGLTKAGCPNSLRQSERGEANPVHTGCLHVSKERQGYNSFACQIQQRQESCFRPWFHPEIRAFFVLIAASGNNATVKSSVDLTRFL